MSFLKFITIDVLCIAAEVTAALLLLAFAIPEKKKAVPSDKVSDEEQEKLLKEARQFCIESAVFRGLAILRSPSLASFHHSEELSESLRSVGYEDKLTHSANHAFAEEFLTKWLRLPTDHRLGSSLAMVVVDDYSDLLRTKGAMEIEAILRQLAEMIQGEFGTNSIISRYQPDRFLILNFGGDIRQAYASLVNLRTKVTTLASDESNEQTAFDCTNSIVDLGEESIDLEQTIEDLDDGISQASEGEDKCVARVINCGWQSTLPEPAADISTNKQHDSQTTDPLIAKVVTGKTTVSEKAETVDGTESNHAESSRSNDESPNSSQQLSSTERIVSEATEGNGPKPPSDVQAVAKNEDIEALFEQINKNKKANIATSAEPSQSTQANRAANALEETIAPATELDTSESATAADIADLFATVKSATQSASQEAKNVPNDAPSLDLDAESDGAASADDIAALFASVKSTKQETKAKSETTADNSPAAKATPADEDLDTAASADDIAALFASVKSTKQETQAKSETTADNSPAAKATPVDEDLDTAASADDIAALFETVNKSVASKTTPAEKSSVEQIDAPKDLSSDSPISNPIEISAEGKKNIESLVQNLNESASADEIEALFANLK